MRGSLPPDEEANMGEHEIHRIETEPGIHLHVESWAPEAPRAVIVLSHGYAEHLGRYGHVVDAFVAAGIAVFALDHRGHGRSDGQRMLIRDMRAAGRDVDRLADLAERAHPDVPLFLLGHSMGSVIATDAAVFDPHRWAGVILSGSPLAISDQVPAAQLAILKGLARVRPAARLSPPLEAELICSVPEVVQAYLDDPLVDNDRMPIGTGAAMLAAADRQPDEIAALADTPVLVIHGEDDALTPIAGSERLMGALGSGDRTFLRYQARHEVLNDTTSEAAIADLIAWIDERIAT